MKKIILATLIATSFSVADFIGGEVNLGYYNHSPSGDTTYKGDTIDIEDDLKWESSGDVFFKAYLEHPAPIIPNIKLGFTNFSHDGNGQVTQDFIWNGQKFSKNEKLETELDLSIYDITLYYEILDNWLNFDIGINIKYLDGTVDVNQEHKSFQTPIPMLYTKARVDLPATDISFQAEGNYISYDDNTLYDLEIGARYTLALGLGFEVGYKSFKLKIDDIDDLSMDTNFNGMYGKVVWDF